MYTGKESGINENRTLMSCIFVEEKFWNDSYLANKDCASVGGISNEEMNSLEHEVLHLLGFNLYIDQETYDTYCVKVCRIFGNLPLTDTTLTSNNKLPDEQD